jgi:DNA primase
MGAIPAETIEQIAAANDIVEVIGSYFPLKRAGASFRALCPFHQEKTPSFQVSPQRQTFHCFGCGVGGSVFRFVMDYEHIDFPAAVRRLAARAGIPVIEERGGSESGDRQQEARRNLLGLHAEAAAWFHENLLKREWAAPARDYLKGRGIEREVVKSWQLGYAPESWDACLKWALDHGYARGLILQSGLVKLRDEERADSEVYDRFRGRLMFPICNDLGEVIAFSGRVLKGDAEGAKYLNSPETPLFRKGSVLFGLHKTKRGLIEAGSAIVCEGQLDLITVFEAGIRNVVAPQGTAFTEQQARILKRFVKEVVLCFDADAAGQKAAERSLEPLLENDLIVRVVAMPAGEDPDSLIRKEGAASFQERVNDAPDFFDLWIDREVSATDLDSLGAKMQLARRMAETAARVHDPMLRAGVISKITARLGVSAVDFEKLLPKPYRARSDENAPRPSGPAPPHEVAMLSLLALRDEEVHAFLKLQNWKELLARTPSSEILARILEEEWHGSDGSSLVVWMASLPPEQESLVASWLVQKNLPQNALAVAEGWWKGLRQAALRRQLQEAESRLKLPRISTGEVVLLQKQILDLRGQLHELATFSSARVLDS